jgi:hypothetical protein
MTKKAVFKVICMEKEYIFRGGAKTGSRSFGKSSRIQIKKKPMKKVGSVSKTNGIWIHNNAPCSLILHVFDPPLSL